MAGSALEVLDQRHQFSPRNGRGFIVLNYDLIVVELILHDISGIF